MDKEVWSQSASGVTSCVTVTRSFQFDEPQFPHLQKGAVCRAGGLLSKDSFVRSIMRV